MIILFSDGHCGLCRRTARTLRAMDWMGRLRVVDLHDADDRRRYAPEISFDDLNRSMHIKFPSGKILNGFSAFRAVAWHLPPLWLAGPFLYLPGAKLIGDRIYDRVAERRKKCTHKNCKA